MMTKLSDGFYAYYVNGMGRPILAEVMAQHVCECGNEGWTPLSFYPGKFIPLIEQPKPEDAKPEHGAAED